MQVKIFGYPVNFLFRFFRKRIPQIFIDHFFSVVKNIEDQKIKSVTLQMQQPQGKNGKKVKKRQDKYFEKDLSQLEIRLKHVFAIEINNYFSCFIRCIYNVKKVEIFRTDIMFFRQHGLFYPFDHSFPIRFSN
jgi:hypothetical protein